MASIDCDFAKYLEKNVPMKNVLARKLSQYSLLLGMVFFMLGGCQQAVEKPRTESAFLLPEVVTLEDFKLENSRLGEFGIDNLKEKWSLFFFGYTHCPDVCPTELYMMAEMMRALEKNPPVDVQPLQVVFVSVDPQRDTPESLQQYASFYHSSFIGITGPQPSVDRLAQVMGVFYERVYHQNGEVVIIDPAEGIPAELENSYLINHSASIFLLNPSGKLQAIFAPPHDPNTMIRDLAVIQAAWR
jgi:protein SCO1/2